MTELKLHVPVTETKAHNTAGKINSKTMPAITTLAFLLLESRCEGEWVGVSMLAEAGIETVTAGV